MIKPKYTILIAILLINGLSVSQGLSYPLKEINIGNCKYTNDCWIDLPIIKEANYTLYQKNHLYRTIYTVLWGAGYKDGWDLGLGTHLGVDIATIKGTPVYSILDGEVILSKENGAWGTVVVVKHIWNDEVIFSTYAHLEKSFVNVGDKIKEGDMIALVGDSGNTTGPHLHRQIEKSSVKTHPFYPYGCGNTIEDSVNSASCWNQLYKHTLDPIRFVENNGYDLNFEKKLKLNTYTNFDELTIITSSGNIGLSGPNNIVSFKNKSKEIDISVLEKPIKIIYDQEKIELNTDYFYTIDQIKSIEAKGLKEGLTQIKIMYGDIIIKKIYYLVISEQKLETLNKHYDLDKILSKINT